MKERESGGKEIRKDRVEVKPKEVLEEVKEESKDVTKDSGEEETQVRGLEERYSK